MHKHTIHLTLNTMVYYNDCRYIYRACRNPRNVMVCDAPYLQNEFDDLHFFFFFFYVFNKILSFFTYRDGFKKICTWELLGANVLNRQKWARKRDRFRCMLRYMINCVTSGYLTLATKWRALVNMPLE